MHFGFFTVHPLTVPFGNELAHSITCIITQGMMVYSGIIKPEIQELASLAELL